MAPEIASNLLPDLSPEERRELAGAKYPAFRKRARAVEPLPGLLDFIAKAREKGIKISLVTNALKENDLAVLRVLGFDEAFDSEYWPKRFAPVSPIRPLRGCPQSVRPRCWRGRSI
ncbi:MAG TPA: hypothetical protein VK361_03280 [Rubrobacteraceae bacterium]|nr:hypothetical protein [Rubrobacteraceae bacterium]